MICPKCKELELKSRVRIMCRTATAMPIHEYYDEEGNWQSEDPNTYTTSFNCSEGHTFALEENKGRNSRKKWKILSGENWEEIEMYIEKKRPV